VIGEERFIDVAQRQLEEDAIGTVERIHDFLEIPLETPTKRAMTRWAEDNQRGARGAHRYSAEQFGTTTEQIRVAFADYIDRFDVEPEDLG